MAFDSDAGDDVVYGGHTHKALAQAFDKVRNKKDWKAPINARIHEDDRDVVDAAIIFYTATVPSFERVGVSPFYRVLADGYRMGPAGDH